MTDREALVNEMDNWLNSVSNFHDNLNEHYAAYPDILSGILLSINQVLIYIIHFICSVFNCLKFVFR